MMRTSSAREVDLSWLVLRGVRLALALTLLSSQFAAVSGLAMAQEATPAAQPPTQREATPGVRTDNSALDRSDTAADSDTVADMEGEPSNPTSVQQLQESAAGQEEGVKGQDQQQPVDSAELSAAQADSEIVRQTLQLIRMASEIDAFLSGRSMPGTDLDAYGVIDLADTVAPPGPVVRAVLTRDDVEPKSVPDKAPPPIPARMVSR